MTVSAVRSRLVTVQENITGVKKAYRHVPRVIQPSEVPAFITFTGSSTYDMAGYGEEEFGEPRLYRMVLFIQEVGAGSEGKAEAAAEPYIELVQDYFNARPGIEDDSATAPRESVFDAQLVGDDGIQFRQYPPGDGQMYVAIEFRLLVTEIKDISYVSA